jgi:predicted amidohydrolase
MEKKRNKRKNPIIALAQIIYYDTDDEHNIAKIKKYIRLAKKKNADIICFSESCVHKTDFLSFDDDLIREIKEECKKNSIWCIIDDDMVIKGKTYNTALLIDRRGKIAGEYRKKNLMGEGYAEIVFCPTYWKYEARAHHPMIYSEKHRKREFETLKSLIMTRAFENMFFVTLCNPAKNKTDKDLIPYSAICTPQKVLKDIKDKEGMIVAEIKLNEIKQLEKLYKEAV